MIIDPNVAIQWLKYAKLENIQQSGIDLTLKSIKLILPGGILHQNGKKTVELEIINSYNNRFFLPPGEYDFECFEYVEVPSNSTAMIIQRSSLNRLGAFITTGYYDNGFQNYIGGVLHVPHPIVIEENARIAQIVFMSSGHEAKYRGQYQGGQSGV